MYILWFAIKNVLYVIPKKYSANVPIPIITTSDADSAQLKSFLTIYG